MDRLEIIGVCLFCGGVVIALVGFLFMNHRAMLPGWFQ